MPDFDIMKAAGADEIAGLVEALMAQTPEPKITAAQLVNAALLAFTNAFGPEAARAMLLNAAEMIAVAAVEARRGLN